MDLIIMNQNDTGLDNKLCYRKEEGYFPLAKDGRNTDICISKQDYKGIAIAAKALSKDIKLVTGKKAVMNYELSSGFVVIAGTIGKNEWIDALISRNLLNVEAIKGKWETYIIETLDHPFDGIEKALVIAGSDKRGTIYGIYKLSEMIGVSAWVWWADSIPVKKEQLLIADGKIVSKEPSVKYRGIFINDENPCFGDWCFAKFGGVNSKMYVYVFELILRLKGNYMWPAMWGKSINIDDPASPRLADEYGVVLGTSHHEPMMRAQKEWTVLGDKYGGHANWNYQTNREGLYHFWEDRIRENKDYEKIVTVGMRGDGDESMIEGGKIDEIIALYEQIVTDQREILAKHINPDVTQIPQVWCLYKEVEEFYTEGMKVPEDITLMLCDDNFGNVRHLPDLMTNKPKEGIQPLYRNRKGGYGMYYHFDYVGGPYSYKWINNMPLQKTWEQMTMAYEYGVDRIWIVNVGDLKPMEFPIEYFLNLAYDIEKWGKRNKVEEYTRWWAEKEFGEKYAQEIATILGAYTKFNGIRKPENLFPNVFHPVNYGEADRILEAYKEISDKAEWIFEKLPKSKKDSFYQLVLYPTKASYLMYRMHISTSRNWLYAKQGRNSANYYARIVNECFVTDWNMSDYYNHVMSKGKWDHMMTQAHIGQTGWRSSEVNVMPELKFVTPIMYGKKLLVAMPDNEEVIEQGEARLPQFTDIGNEAYTIVLGNAGETPVACYIEASQPWIVLKIRLEGQKGARPFDGFIQTTTYEDCYLEVSIDWSKIPGQNKTEHGYITVKADNQTITVHVSASRYDINGLEPMTYIDTHGILAMEAEHYAKNVAMGKGEWKVIPDYGRSLSSMKVFPVDLGCKVPEVDAPYLEYRFATGREGAIKVLVYSAPSNNLSADTGMRYAISVDDETPRIVENFDPKTPVGYGHIWEKGVMMNCRIAETKHSISKRKVHTVRIYMVDSGFVLQRLVIDCDNKLLPSFLGPQETYYTKQN